MKVMKFIQIVAVVLVVGVIEASSAPTKTWMQVAYLTTGQVYTSTGPTGDQTFSTYGKLSDDTINTYEWSIIKWEPTSSRFPTLYFNMENLDWNSGAARPRQCYATSEANALAKNWICDRCAEYTICNFGKGHCGGTVKDTYAWRGGGGCAHSSNKPEHLVVGTFKKGDVKVYIYTAKPTSEPTAEPTSEPTAEPTAEPTSEPTHEICPVNYHSSIVENFPNTADQCNCGSDTNQVCTKNQFCYGTQCHLNAHSCNAGAHKDVFYGGKVKGSWLKKNKKIEMSIKTPYDVKIKSIVWQTSSFQNIDDKTLKYDVSDSSLATKWALTSGTQTEPCKTVYALSVPTKTYFGAGSEFTLKYVAKTQDIAEKYELRSSVKVTAEQEMSYTSSKGIAYTYTRNVINNLPIFVKLQTKSTITVTFKMISGPTPLSDNFVLFVGGEEGMEGGKHMVTLEMISFSANGLADVTSGGITITKEAAKIKSGTNIFSYTSETDTENFDREGNLVKDYITWTFEPKEVFKSTSYDITLRFKDKNSAETWEAIAAIHIEAEDLMTEVSFETDVSLYSDQQCLNSATTFKRGAGLYTKVVLSEEIVEIESIACSKFIVKQYSNPKIDGADALVEKHMIVENDRFSFTQTKLQDSNTQDIKNTLVCGVELDSADFYVSKEGYPTELSIEVTVTYKKDKTTIRRILSVPVASNWKLMNPQLYSEQEIGEAESFAPLNDYGMENNDDVAAVGSSDESNDSYTGNTQGSEQMTTNFLMTEGNGLGYASETAIATENDANSEAANMGIRITFGAVFLCTAGISIYLRKIWVKSNEYTPLLD